ncbi:hypothetical protein LX36DRAFT_403624 [Colletotrichum falcatum]|nr:hypothetical protein LX36DRAFT_403624 [Colletotrichum falcatum]
MTAHSSSLRSTKLLQPRLYALQILYSTPRCIPGIFVVALNPLSLFFFHLPFPSTS